MLKSALRRRSKATPIKRLRVNGTDFTELDKISKQFDKYFCSIASDILKESEEFDSSDISFESYITKLPKQIAHLDLNAYRQLTFYIMWANYPCKVYEGLDQ